MLHLFGILKRAGECPEAHFTLATARVSAMGGKRSLEIVPTNVVGAHSP